MLCCDDFQQVLSDYLVDPICQQKLVVDHNNFCSSAVCLGLLIDHLNWNSERELNKKIFTHTQAHLTLRDALCLFLYQVGWRDVRLLKALV